MFLYQRILEAKKYNAYAPLPQFIKDNLTERFEIRPYQEEAFCNYITYFENDQLRQYRNQTLFHMATGSGKTFIMAGLMLYLYEKGYRNFLFFVSLSNIVSKTKDNFINVTSSKYLFADKIVINGKEVKIREVASFQNTSDDCINICFSTIQAIHRSYTDIREGSLSIDDFYEKDVVFISDEAHHLTVDTARGNKKILDKEQMSWEYVVKKLFKSNPKNVLLEFTATCKLENEFIMDEYKDKIVHDYDLKKFRIDGYSKEIQTLQTDLSFIDMSIQAIILSQYRLKLFNDIHKDVKPVILFKSRTKTESRAFYKQFIDEVSKLNGNKISKFSSVPNELIKKVFSYFNKKGISFDMLAEELKNAFSSEHCIEINEDSDITSDEIVLNRLEERDNPYRAIFEVRKLDEGWDVLNLFDIVRLYDTRDAKDGIPGPTTVSEAQLIGRGARYFPFTLEDFDNKYKRKFDSDLENPLRICEELYYHCHTNSRYIDELHKALIDTGMRDSAAIQRRLFLKSEFKKTRMYEEGIVFVNRQVESDRSNVHTLPSKIKDGRYSYTLPSRRTSISPIFKQQPSTSKNLHTTFITIGEISAINYNVAHSALRRYPKFEFNVLKLYFPHLKSTREFIQSPDYLGDVGVDISHGTDEIPRVNDLFLACIRVFNKISDELSFIEKTYVGSRTFKRLKFKDVFRDKIVNYSDPTGEGVGVSQSEVHTWRLDLSDEEWFVFNDNYGTGEEKGFVYHFAKHVRELKKKYTRIYLVRNERHMHIYSFSEGRRFEPDFVLFLINEESDGVVDQMQIFIEPKGTHLMKEDRWKEEFLMEIADKWEVETITLIDDSKYRVIGLPFYNNEHLRDFERAFEEVVQSRGENSRSYNSYYSDADEG